MTSAEHYREGFSEGCRYAEQDIRDGRNQEAELRDEASNAMDWVDYSRYEQRAEAAYRLGMVRGYRDTVARFESGALSFEMFERSPL